MSRDGKSIYVGSTESVAVARIVRQTTNGNITQPVDGVPCISEDGSGACADGHGLGGGFPWSVDVSPGGLRVYVASGGALARFNRER